MPSQHDTADDSADLPDLDLTERLELVQGLGQLGVFSRDLRTGIGAWDAQVFRIYGLDPAMPTPGMDELQRRLIHPDDQDAFRAAHQDLHGQQGRRQMRFRIVRPDGEVRHLHSLFNVRQDGSGRAILVGVLIDVSEVFSTREGQHDLLQRMDLVASAVGVAFWSRDNDADRAHWDARMFRMHHRDPARGAPGIDEWLQEHVHPLDRDWMRAHQAESHARWDPLDEVLFRIPDGAGGARWVQSWTRRSRRDGVRVSHGVHLDVTDREVEQREIRRERGRIASMLDAAGIGVWERRLDGRPSYLSPAARRLRGLAENDPRPYEDMVRQTTLAEDASGVDAALSTPPDANGAYAHEWRVRLPDGAVRWLTAYGQATRDDAGAVVSIGGVTVDVTERKQAQLLVADRVQQETVARAKAEFLSGLGREWRAPLRQLHSGLSQLLDDTEDPPTLRQAQKLRQLMVTSERLARSIDAGLQVAEAPPGAPVPIQPLRLDRMLQAALDQLDAPLRARATGAKWNRAERPATVMAEPHLLDQALQRMLAHVLRRAAPGETLAATLKPEVRHGQVGWRLDINPTTDGAAVVQDQGGSDIDAVDSGWATYLLQPMGAELIAVPGDTVGIHAWLRASDAEPLLAEAPPLSPNRGDMSRYRVLCVEDNPVNLLLLRELFGLRPAIELHTAVDGAQALTMASRLQPQAILLDLHLPDLHGTEVMLRLRSDPNLAQAHFIALSANAMPDDIGQAMRAGFDDYWTKPIDVRRFLDNIDAMADGRWRGPSG
ncbi:MAG: PAS domain-containing protein [Aquabacterium sp.]